jgi:hypothetical protein
MKLNQKEGQPKSSEEVAFHLCCALNISLVFIVFVS